MIDIGKFYVFDNCFRDCLKLVSDLPVSFISFNRSEQTINTVPHRVERCCEKEYSEVSVLKGNKPIVSQSKESNNRQDDTHLAESLSQDVLKIDLYVPLGLHSFLNHQQLVNIIMHTFKSSVHQVGNRPACIPLPLSYSSSRKLHVIVREPTRNTYSRPEKKIYPYYYDRVRRDIDKGEGQSSQNKHNRGDEVRNVEQGLTYQIYIQVFYSTF